MENNPFVMESFHSIHEIIYIVEHTMGEVVVHLGNGGSLLVYAETRQGGLLSLTRKDVEDVVKATGAEVVQLYQKTDKTWVGRVACHYGEVSL